MSPSGWSQWLSAERRTRGSQRGSLRQARQRPTHVPVTQRHIGNGHGGCADASVAKDDVDLAWQREGEEFSYIGCLGSASLLTKRRRCLCKQASAASSSQHNTSALHPHGGASPLNKGFLVDVAIDQHCLARLLYPANQHLGLSELMKAPGRQCQVPALGSERNACSPANARRSARAGKRTLHQGCCGCTPAGRPLTQQPSCLLVEMCPFSAGRQAVERGRE